MDFTPEWKIVKEACLLNTFLNDNDRSIVKSSTSSGNNNDNDNNQSKVINASCMLNEFLNENHRNMYQTFENRNRFHCCANKQFPFEKLEKRNRLD